MTHRHRWPEFAAATVLIAGGLGAAVAPAHALPPTPLAPPACQQWGFGGTTNIIVNGRTVASFTADGPSFLGDAKAGDLTVPTSAVVHENNYIEISQHMPGPEGSGGAEQSYNGVVGPDGMASGQSHNTSPIVSGSPAWASAAPLKCIKEAAAEAPKQGPTVSFEQILGGLNVHITDRSGVTSQCTYDADGFTRTFRLDANGSADLKIVPAVPKFDNWNINVTCDNGTSTQTTQFF